MFVVAKKYSIRVWNWSATVVLFPVLFVSKRYEMFYQGYVVIKSSHYTGADPGGGGGGARRAKLENI